MKQPSAGLARRQIDAGIHFLVPCGTTGENSDADRGGAHCASSRLVVDEAKGSVPVLAGAGGYDTHEVDRRRRSRWQRAGADGLLSVTPYYNKPTPEGLYQHYSAIAESSAAADHRLQRARAHRRQRRCRRRSCGSARCPNIVGVKEASGNMSQMCEICRAVPSDFLVLSGDDALTLPVMAVGGRGIISVPSNEIPAEMAQMVELPKRGRFRRRATDPPRTHAADADQLHRIEPDSGEGGDGDDGPARRSVSAAARAAAAAIARPDRKHPARSGAANRSGNGPRLSLTAFRTHAVQKDDRVSDLASEISALFEAGASADRDQARAAFCAVAGGVVGRHGSRRRTGPVGAVRLAREHLGEAGHPARLPRSATSSTCRPITAAGRSSTRTRCR